MGSTGSGWRGRRLETPGGSGVRPAQGCRMPGCRSEVYAVNKGQLGERCGWTLCFGKTDLWAHGGHRGQMGWKCALELWFRPRSLVDGRWELRCSSKSVNNKLTDCNRTREVSGAWGDV